MNLPSDDLEIRAQAANRQGNKTYIRLNRWWHILKFYRTSQILRRTLGLLKQIVTGKRYSIPNLTDHKSLEIRTTNSAAFDQLAKIKRSACNFDSDSTVQNLQSGKIQLLNRTESIAKLSDQSLLWQFQFHYHEYLLALDSDHIGLVEKQIVDWLERFPMEDRAGHQSAWHPYSISRRIPVWISLMSSLPLSDELKNRMLNSCSEQTEFLSANLEWDLRGNHLIENIRAICLAGCFFKSGDHWLAKTKQVLSSQISEQILAWGEHFETCPMYHCQVLANFLEMMLVSRDVDSEIFRILTTPSDRMLGFLELIVHPDGEIPLLGDSCFGEAPSVQSVFDLAMANGLEPGSIDAEDCPYWIHRKGNQFLIFDRGQSSASWLPAHGHCDLLGIEASVDSSRIIVDSGLYNYDDDSMRAYCRSSFAHNVVMVDESNQHDTWSKFRMGRRGQVVRTDRGHDNGFDWASGFHDGFRHLGIAETGRLIAVRSGEYWMCVDTIARTTRTTHGFLHLAPESTLSRLENWRYRLTVDEQVFDVSFFGVLEVKIVKGWYCSGFGKREPTTTLEYVLDPNVIQAGGWLFRFQSPRPESKCSVEVVPIDSSTLEIQVNDPSGDFQKLRWNINK
ncbi:MAG: alginate lyase family protein [Planctomycetota bacterium]